jgi:hypothetical protein
MSHNTVYDAGSALTKVGDSVKGSVVNNGSCAASNINP